jgi:hypothetical protein
MMFDDGLDVVDSVADQAAPDVADGGHDVAGAANISAGLTAIAGSETGATVADDQERDGEFSDAERDDPRKGAAEGESRDTGHPTSSGDAETAADTGVADTAEGKSDRSGILRLYNFERDVDRKMEAYRRDGKDPLDLLDPSKPDYLGTPEALLPHFGPDVAAAAARSRAAQAAELDRPFGTSEEQTRRGLTPIPVHSDDSAIARPPGLPVFPGTPEWEDMFVRGMQGLVHALRGRFGRSRNDGDDDFCYKRYNDEVDRCLERSRQDAHRPYTRGCMERAAERRNLCVQNGGRPNPNEPLEWNPDRDEEAWINPDR